MSVVELEPGLDQVVFAGDSLRLRCRVTSAEEGHRVWWARGNTRLMPREPTPNSSATVTGYLDQHLQREGAIVKNTFLPEAIERFVCHLLFHQYQSIFRTAHHGKKNLPCYQLQMQETILYFLE